MQTGVATPDCSRRDLGISSSAIYQTMLMQICPTVFVPLSKAYSIASVRGDTNWFRRREAKQFRLPFRLPPHWREGRNSNPRATLELSRVFLGRYQCVIG